MEKFCISCDQDTTYTLQDINLPLGKKSFPASTHVCESCGAYALTPKIRAEMDKWADQFQDKFIEHQPFFSEALLAQLENEAALVGTNRTHYMRMMMGFYLTQANKEDRFQMLREAIPRTTPGKLLSAGKKESVKVPMNYRAHRLLEMYGQAWGITPTKALEEAVLYCSVLDKMDNDRRFSKAAAHLKIFIESAALAA